MEFRTPIPIQKSSHPVDYNSRIVSLGSCFAVNISEKLSYYKFRNTVNPFGILFHPLAIEKLLFFVSGQKQFITEDIFFHNERWHSFDVHSDLSNADAAYLLADMNAKVQQTYQNISEATHIIITLGTAWVYKQITTDAYVANCHKVPQKQFVKELLSLDAIIVSLSNIIKTVQQLNPLVKVLFTVSPVRHIKDGFVENQVSKAHLISAVYQVVNTSYTVDYFPAYEIMMDELRDYRFYTDDMLHPGTMAINYIWERFKDTYVRPEAYPVMKEVSAVQSGKAHQPFNPESQAYKEFMVGLSEKINRLNTAFPFMEF